MLSECTQHSNAMLYWIVVLAIETGMRRGEIVGLRRGQLDRQRRTIRLPDTKNGSARSVPLTKRAVQVLEEALNHSIRPIDTDLVFWGDTRDRATGERKP